MTFVINSFPVPDQGGRGLGGRAPAPPQDAVSALIKKNNNKTHDMICVIWYMYCLTYDLDYPDDDGLPTILLKERVAVGAQTGL